jgi:hypothetical protein
VKRILPSILEKLPYRVDALLPKVMVNVVRLFVFIVGVEMIPVFTKVLEAYVESLDSGRPELFKEVHPRWPHVAKLKRTEFGENDARFKQGSIFFGLATIPQRCPQQVQTQNPDVDTILQH